MIRRSGEEVVRAGAVAALLILPHGAFGQEAVGLVSTREGSRSTGLTGEWVWRSPTAPPPSAWPTANSGQGWGVVGQSPKARLNTTLSTHFDAAGLTTPPQPPPSYKFDVYGNQIYRNQATGRSETFGVTIQRAP
jgi:hypothetical protein